MAFTEELRTLQAATRAFLAQRRYAFVSVRTGLRPETGADGVVRQVSMRKGRTRVAYASCLRGPHKIDRREVRAMLRCFSCS